MIKYERLSFAIKAKLDEITGLKFSPIFGVSKQIPICWYSIDDLTNENLNQSTLEVRVVSDDFDEIEVIREKIKNGFTAQEKDSWIECGNYLIRAKLSGGGILSDGTGSPVFDSTQFIQIKWIKKG